MGKTEISYHIQILSVFHRIRVKRRVTIPVLRRIRKRILPKNSLPIRGV
jgi:hypothetical protein